MADVDGDGNAPGSYTWEDFTESLDLDAMIELGNQWILLGDALYGGQTGMAADVAAFDWTGTTGTTAESTWTSNMGPVVNNAAEGAWTVGQSIHAYVEGIKEQAGKMAEEANKQYFTMIFSFLLNVVLLPLGIAASFIGLVARLIGTIVNVIGQIATRMGWLAASAAEFAAGAVVGGVTTFGIDMAALGLGTAAAGADWHVDWGQEGINIGMGAAFGGVLGGIHGWAANRNRVPIVIPPPGLRKGGGNVPATTAPGGSGGPGRGGGRPGDSRPTVTVTPDRTPINLRGDTPGQSGSRGPGGPPPKTTPDRSGTAAANSAPVREAATDTPGSAPVREAATDTPGSAPVQRHDGPHDSPALNGANRNVADPTPTPVPPVTRPPSRSPAPSTSEGTTPAGGGSRGPGGNTPVVTRPGEQDTPAPLGPPAQKRGSGGQGGFEVHVDIRRPTDPVPESSQPSFTGPGRRLGDAPAPAPVKPPVKPGDGTETGGPPSPGSRGDDGQAPPVRPDSQTTRLTLDFLPGKSGDASPKSSSGGGTPGRTAGDDAPRVTVKVERVTDPQAGPPRSPFEGEGRTLDGGTVPGRGEPTVPIRGIPEDEPGRINVWIEGQEIRVGPGELGSGTYVVHPGVRNFHVTDGDVRVHIGRDQPDPAATPQGGRQTPFGTPGRRLDDGRVVPPDDSPAPQGDSGAAPASPPPKPANVEYGQPVTFTFGDRPGGTPPGGAPPRTFSGDGHVVGGSKAPERGTPSEHAGQAAHDRSGPGDQGPPKSPLDGRRDETSSGPATVERPGRNSDTHTVPVKRDGRSSSSSPSGEGRRSGGGGAGHRPGASTIEVHPVQQRTPVSDDGTPVAQMDVGMPEPAAAPAFARPVNRGGPGESAFTGDGRVLGGPERAVPPRDGTSSGPAGTGGGKRPLPSQGGEGGSSPGKGGSGPSRDGSREPSPSRPSSSSSSSTSSNSGESSTSSMPSPSPVAPAPVDDIAPPTTQAKPAALDTPAVQGPPAVQEPVGALPHQWADGGGFEVQVDIRRPAARPGTQATTRLTLDFVPAEPGVTSPRPPSEADPNAGIADITVRVEEAQPRPAPPPRPFTGDGRTLDGGVVPARTGPSVPIRGMPPDTPGRIHIWHDGQIVEVAPGRLENGRFVVHPGVRNFELTDGTITVPVGVGRTADDPAANAGSGPRSPFDGPGRRLRDGRQIGQVVPVPPPREQQAAPGSPPPEPARVEYGQPVTFTFADEAAEPVPPATVPVEGRPLGGPETPARGTPSEHAGQAAHDRSGEKDPLEFPADRPRDRTSAGPAAARKPGRSGAPHTVASDEGRSSTPPASGRRPGASTVELQPVQQQAPLPNTGTPVIRVDVGLPEPTPAFARPVNRGQAGEPVFSGEGRTLGGSQKPAPQGEGTSVKQSSEPKAPAQGSEGGSTSTTGRPVEGAPASAGRSEPSGRRQADPAREAALEGALLADAAEAARARRDALWTAYLQADADHTSGVESSNTGARVDDLGTRVQIAALEEEAARAGAEAAGRPPVQPPRTDVPTVRLSGDYDPASSTLQLGRRPRDAADTRRWIGRNTAYEPGDPVELVVPGAASNPEAIAPFAEDLATGLGGPVRIVTDPATGAGITIPPRREPSVAESPAGSDVSTPPERSGGSRFPTRSPATTEHPQAATPELADYFRRQEDADAAWQTWGDLAAELQFARAAQASGTGGTYIDAEVNALEDALVEAEIDAGLADIGASIAAEQATEAQIRRHGPGTAAADPGPRAPGRFPAALDTVTPPAETARDGGVLVVHGELDAGAGTLTEDGRPLDLDGTVAWITGNPAYSSGMPVSLVTPGGGRPVAEGEPSFAGDLATRLGADVLVVDPATGDGVLHVPPARPDVDTDTPATAPESVPLPESVGSVSESGEAVPEPVVTVAEPVAAVPPAEDPPGTAPPRRSPWYLDVSAMGEATIERVDRWTPAEIQNRAGQVGNAVARPEDGPRLAAGIRDGLGAVLANEGTSEADIAKWQDLFQNGRSFVVDGRLVWIRPVLQDASLGTQPTGGVRKFKVSFASMMSGGKTGGGTTQGIDGLLLTFFGVGTSAAATLISGLPTFTASSSTKAEQGRDRALIAGRKLFVANNTRFDSGMGVKVFVDGVERPNDVRLPRRFAVDFPEPLTS
ncbi:hypothetical protein E1293_18620, partial [Actinomadura darangshiensis]